MLLIVKSVFAVLEFNTNPVLWTCVKDTSLSEPKLIGQNEFGKDIYLKNGRFGPYVKHENTFASVKDDNEDILTIGINRAVDLIVEKESKPPSERRFTRKKAKK